MTEKDLIFISYRRDDSISETGRIHEHLVREFGSDCAFKDSNNIDHGDRYPERLEQALGRCQLAVVVMGKKWLTIEKKDNVGVRRLDDPNDWVHHEVKTFLIRGIPILPVFVQEATMPESSKLPEPLRALESHQGEAVREDKDFEPDIKALVQSARTKLLEYRKRFFKNIVSEKTFVYREYVCQDEGVASRVLSRLFGRENNIEISADVLVRQIDWCLGSENETLELIEVPEGVAEIDVDTYRGIGRSHHIKTTIPSFCIGKYPVTQQQWKTISNFSNGHLELEPFRFRGSKKPVESITHSDAEKYCNILSELTSRTFRLPSVAEWQHACKAGTFGLSPYGRWHDLVCIVSAEYLFEDRDSSEFLSEDHDTSKNRAEDHKMQGTRDLFNTGSMSKQFWPNRFGLYHMLGNVSEWCKDSCYSVNAQEFSSLSAQEKDYCRSMRATCGGSFKHPKSELNSYTAEAEDSRYRHEHVGFRVVMEI